MPGLGPESGLKPMKRSVLLVIWMPALGGGCDRSSGQSDAGRSANNWAMTDRHP